LFVFRFKAFRMMMMMMMMMMVYLQDECWPAADGDDRSRGRCARDNSAMTSSSRHHCSTTSYEAISSFTRRSHISVIPKMCVYHFSQLNLMLVAFSISVLFITLCVVALLTYLLRNAPLSTVVTSVKTLKSTVCHFHTNP